MCMQFYPWMLTFFQSMVTRFLGLWSVVGHPQLILSDYLIQYILTALVTEHQKLYGCTHALCQVVISQNVRYPSTAKFLQLQHIMNDCVYDSPSTSYRLHTHNNFIECNIIISFENFTYGKCYLQSNCLLAASCTAHLLVIQHNTCF